MFMSMTREDSDGTVMKKYGTKMELGWNKLI